MIFGAAPAGVIESTLPPIPSVTGPLSLYVEYPDSLQRIAVSDTNFIHGTVRTGDATLIIDGEFVEVEPNGTFLAWLPVPRAAAGDTAYYQLIAPVLLPLRDPDIIAWLVVGMLAALPAAAAAGMIAATVLWFNYFGQTGPIKHGGVLAMIFILSFLMVSNFNT